MEEFIYFIAIYECSQGRKETADFDNFINNRKRLEQNNLCCFAAIVPSTNIRIKIA
jgi:hypothetical protein